MFNGIESNFPKLVNQLISTKKDQENLIILLSIEKLFYFGADSISHLPFFKYCMNDTMRTCFAGSSRKSEREIVKSERGAHME